MARREYQREQDQADGIKRKHDDFSQAKNPTNIEPRIVIEARKRRGTQQPEQPPSRGAFGTVQDSRIAKLVNVQGREEAASRVAWCIYACGIPFNVVRSPHW